MKKNIKIIEKIVLSAIWVCFGIYLVLQFSKMQIYYDDFGYYSLSYGIDTPKVGHTYSFLELLSFLGNHYLKVNGRLLYFFVWLFSFMVGGITLVRLLAATGVFAVFFLGWILIQKANKGNKINNILSAIFICFCYGLLEISILNYGVYWTAAYFQYVFALVPFLGFVLLYFNKREHLKKTSLLIKLFLVFLVFATGWSQESWSVAIVGFMGMLIIYEIIEKKISVIHFVFFSVSIICLFILIRCPGILLRAGSLEKFYSLSLLGKISKKTPEVLAIFFNMRLFQIGLSFSQIFMGVYLFIKDQSRKWKIFDVGYTICFILVDFAYLRIYTSYEYLFSRKGRTNPVFILFEVFLLILIFIQVSRYYLKQNKIGLLLIFYATVLSIACLVVVPQIPLRLYLPIALLSSILITDVIVNTIGLIKNWKTLYLISFVSAIIMAKLTVPNLYMIYTGYSENAIIWMENDTKMKEASKNIANGEKVNSVIMKKLPLTDYSGEMIYFGVADYMRYWMCNYYNLPQNIELIFEEYKND